MCHAGAPALSETASGQMLHISLERVTLQVFIGDSITVDSFEFILPLLSEASNHPQAFLEFLSAKVSFGSRGITIAKKDKVQEHNSEIPCQAGIPGYPSTLRSLTTNCLHRMPVLLERLSSPF